MNLCRLTYRLKGDPKILEKLFESFEEAMDFLVTNNLQVVVGNLPNIEHPEVIKEVAAKNSRADWHEFSHVNEVW